MSFPMKLLVLLFLLSFATPTPMMDGDLATPGRGRWCEGKFGLAAVGTTQSRWEGLLLPLLSRTCACHAMFVSGCLGGTAAKPGFPE